MNGPPIFCTVPRLFARDTIAILGSGPSLCREDVAVLVAARVRILAINNAHEIAPEADVLFAADRQWWDWNLGVPSFNGLKYTLERPGRHVWPRVQQLKKGRHGALHREPDTLGTGYTSGFSAINLAVHLGAARIVLLGYDMHGRHFFGEHPNHTVPPFAMAIPMFDRLIAPLADLGIEILNASPRTAITAFPRATLAEALESREVTQ